MTLQRYLGKHISEALRDPLLKGWKVTRSVESDLPSPIHYYVFDKRGLEIQADSDDRITSILISSVARVGPLAPALDVQLNWRRPEVLAHLGAPSESGSPQTIPGLGDYGAWDLFDRDGSSVHVQYEKDSDHIQLVTLMQTEAVPR